MDEDWIFKVTAAGSEYKIWASGRTEGFGPGHVVFNRIPQLIALRAAEARGLPNDGQ